MILPGGCCDMTFPSLPTRDVLLHPVGQFEGPRHSCNKLGEELIILSMAGGVV